MNYCIGSLNLRDFNFSNTASDGSQEKIARDFKKIAEIIVNENFDVVALQEINASLPLKYLINILNLHKSVEREYDYNFGAEMPSRSWSKDPERYAFIWNKRRLRLLKVRRGNNPQYYQNAGAIDLIRPPYYARFTARGMLGGSNFELRLIDTHIHQSGGEGSKLLEFNTLVKQVLPRICDHSEISENDEIMPAYTFLMGDYNLILNRSERSIYRVETVTTTTYTGRRRAYRTVQEEPTSLKLPRSQIKIEECYANNYDHFTYEVDLDTKLRLVPQRVEALGIYFRDVGEAGEKLKNYRTKVSDHVPIKLTVALK